MNEIKLVYRSIDGVELEGLLYQPDGPPPYDLVIDVHGGAWSSGHYESGRFYATKLAEAGICVFAINFRHGPDFSHPSASSDIAAAIRFAKSALGIEYTQIGLVGSSSGGHLALYTSLLPNVAAHQEEAADISAEVDFVIALWPVSNPLARYQYVLAWEQAPQETLGPNFTPDRLARGSMSYFRSREAMNEASIQRILALNKFQDLPRVFVVQPELDLNVPVFMTESLHGALLDAGADVKYKLYRDVAHGFASSEGPQTGSCIEDMIKFIAAVPVDIA